MIWLLADTPDYYLLFLCIGSNFKTRDITIYSVTECAGQGVCVCRQRGWGNLWWPGDILKPHQIIQLMPWSKWAKVKLHFVIAMYFIHNNIYILFMVVLKCIFVGMLFVEDTISIGMDININMVGIYRPKSYKSWIIPPQTNLTHPHIMPLSHINTLHWRAVNTGVFCWLFGIHITSLSWLFHTQTAAQLINKISRTNYNELQRILKICRLYVHFVRCANTWQHQYIIIVQTSHTMSMFDLIWHNQKRGSSIFRQNLEGALFCGQSLKGAIFFGTDQNPKYIRHNIYIQLYIEHTVKRQPMVERLTALHNVFIEL